jgi:hypothetical protein
MKHYEVLISDKANEDMEAIHKYVSETLLAPIAATNQYDRIADAIKSIDKLKKSISILVFLIYLLTLLIFYVIVCLMKGGWLNALSCSFRLPGLWAHPGGYTLALPSLRQRAYRLLCALPLLPAGG